MDSNQKYCRHGLRMKSCRTCNLQDPPPSRRGTNGVMRYSSGRRSPENSATYFNHSWEEWFEMQDAGRNFLERCAQAKRMPEYDEFWLAVKIGVGHSVGSAWRQVPQLLRQISEQSLRENRLAITALVVSGGVAGGPNEGFFSLSVREGLLEESETPKKGEEWTGMSKKQRNFWLRHVQEIFDFYG